jgi:beta-glucosidase
VSLGFLGGDRTHIDLPERQKKLLEAVVATGKPIVLVLINGSALAVNWANEHVPAWYPGEEGGTAIADYNPAGQRSYRNRDRGAQMADVQLDHFITIS